MQVAIPAKRDVFERILRHLDLWPACRDARGAGREQGVRVLPGMAPPRPAKWVIEPWAVLPSPSLFHPRLDCVRSAFCPDLTPSTRIAIYSAMKALLPAGSSGSVPVPPEKRFLISFSQ